MDPARLASYKYRTALANSIDETKGKNFPNAEDENRFGRGMSLEVADAIFSRLVDSGRAS